ncbi:hypothetical protein QOV31_005243 (plasmid) [Agrobacterium fabrum]|uniref:TL-DNA for ORF2 n=1 Tax=Rhizobium rhizogenes TaxID=359 RepID=O86104_RHIRH|nr:MULTISPECIES: hypothetical protein [Rhizobium/Agrobacterium group]KEA04446.1 hypothetical protein CN09_19085 [Rhizobium rhizogenes]NMV72345.1 hypothetical protein [Agrobacterium fabrum]NTF72656.1 hypothetical protein [Rhizobium rhizogenes]NTI85369.1 hypothetical protein [Rhizobium rhizogenes]NTJ27552.1 hypothetical protein [Rhizobium rhizogenes]
MSLISLIPDAAERVRRSLADSSLRALLAFDGDGTTFKQDRNHQCWDINPAINIIANLTRIACKGHYQLLTSARECEEIARSVFSAIENIGFQGNDGMVTIYKDDRFDSFSLPNWQAVHAAMENKFGGIPGIRNIPMGHFYGCQMWESHKSYKEAGEMLSSLIGNQSSRKFKVVAAPEGQYLVPVETVGKSKGYFTFVKGLSHGIGLHIACGNGSNDRDMLTAIGNLENGLAFWVGAAETKPSGTNVFVVPDEDALSAILGELGELLPDRSQ